MASRKSPAYYDHQFYQEILSSRCFFPDHAQLIPNAGLGAHILRVHEYWPFLPHVHVLQHSASMKLWPGWYTTSIYSQCADENKQIINHFDRIA